MCQYFVKKLLTIIPMLLAVSIMVFLALELMPIDPINYLASPDMAANAQNLEALRNKLGLNDPIWLRYIHWIGGMLHGDFGYSIVNGAKIGDLIALKLPATLELAGAALILSTVMGIGIGLISSIRQNSIIDYIGRVFGVIGNSIPQFFFGIVVIQLFSIKLGWLPLGGRVNPGDVTFWDRLPNLALPAFTMAIAMTATLLRYTRNSMLDVLNKDYIKTARSKGIPEWKVYTKHAFRNSLGPVLVILCFRLPMLVGGSVVIENIFAWPGIGSTLLQAVSANDYPVIMMITLMIAAAILLASFLVDVMTALLDPRIRFS
ncbi:ABC transporter permease [Clostridium porci]|uniref:ABC transporter permease n=1 Tax=Clostridium porci TaxID=2605778 RepID=A0A7X2NMT5_9CLOT|nr:ABC transporter permease [Clostridium porci]MSS37754.1 ABC transporter permease [Clostridium porci]